MSGMTDNPIHADIANQLAATIMPQLESRQEGDVGEEAVLERAGGRSEGCGRQLEHVAVGEFESAAGCQAAGESGDLHAGFGESIGDQEGRAVAFEIRDWSP